VTTLAGIQGQGWCVIGADSLIVDDPRKYIMPKSAGKIFKVSGYIVAIAGDIRPLQIVQHMMAFPQLPASSDHAELDKFMVQEIIPSLREAFNSENYQMDKDTSWSMMIAIRGLIYILDNDLTWTRDKRGLYGEGSGGDVALGAMNAWLYPDTPAAAKEIVRKSIAIAAQYDINTKEPIVIYYQDNK